MGPSEGPVGRGRSEAHVTVWWAPLMKRPTLPAPGGPGATTYSRLGAEDTPSRNNGRGFSPLHSRRRPRGRRAAADSGSDARPCRAARWPDVAYDGWGSETDTSSRRAELAKRAGSRGSPRRPHTHTRPSGPPRGLRGRRNGVRERGSLRGPCDRLAGCADEAAGPARPGWVRSD